jgi:hypothetical protein
MATNKPNAAQNLHRERRIDCHAHPQKCKSDLKNMTARVQDGKAPLLAAAFSLSSEGPLFP